MSEESSLLVNIRCKACNHQTPMTVGEWDALNVFTCPGCGHVVQFDGEEEELEELREDFWALEPEFEIVWPDGFYYLAPIIRCDCGSMMELPYSNLPPTNEQGLTLLGGTDQLELPPEEWSVIFGCLHCARIQSYGAAQVEWMQIHKWKEGSYQSGKGVFCATVPCGDRHCKTPASFLVDIKSGNASEVVHQLRSGVFDEKPFPCGHKMRTIPERFYGAEPILKRLW